jgi:serine/threonine protein phosphatase 1
MKRVFAIGDIHGCIHTFKKLLLDKIKVDKSDKIYCLGDYIDRGHDSKGVIDFILQLRSEGYEIHTIRGNHEQMLLDSIMYEFEIDRWLENGGGETMGSFGICSLSELPEKYLSFFRETKLCIKTEGFIFVHAGLNFNKKDILEDKDAMLWIRGFDPLQPALKDQILIHGHTPKSLKYILNQKGNCINIDGGCVYNEHKNLGNLVAFDLNERTFVIEKNGELNN